MRAIVFDGKLRYRTDYPEPEPINGEALVRVLCAGICSTDIEITKGYMGFAAFPGTSLWVK
jgi:alcohol dehydrogenase